MSYFRLTKLQLGKEASPLVGAAATSIWPGEAELKFGEKIATPTYMTGEAGYTVENTFVGDTETVLTLKDTYMSPELLTWFLTNSLTGASTSGSIFPFDFATTAAVASPLTFSWEYALSQQEYEFSGYGESFNIHGDVNANEGLVMFNGVVRGESAASSTLTSSLSPITGHFAGTLPVANGKIHLNALGTAASTSASIATWLRAFSVDFKTGWHGGRYMSGATNRDIVTVEGGGTDYEITGTLKVLANSNAVTEIANARYGTGRVLRLQLTGAGSRYVYLDIPFSYTEAPTLGNETENGLVFVTLNFKGGYSRTSTAQGPKITTGLAAAQAIG